MQADTATVPQLIDEFTAAIKTAYKFEFLVRDSDLQQEQVEILTILKNRIKGFKYEAINAGEERDANILFHLQCVLNAHISILTMWILLKKNDHYGAWDKLIDTSEYISIAMKAGDGGIGLEEFLSKLQNVEDVIFPGYKVYQSIGAVITGEECSICGKPFYECDHLDGKVYWGHLCVRINAKTIKGNHIALVENPRDRRCIITEISTKDGWYKDYMTSRKIREIEDGKIPDDAALLCNARFFCNVLLEID